MSTNRFRIADRWILRDPWPDGFGYEASDLEDIFIKGGMGGWVEPFPIPGAQTHAGMTRAPNGDIVLLFDGICSDLRDGEMSSVMRSADQGRTWSPPEDFIIPGVRKKPGKKGMHGGLTTTAAGRILCPYCESTTLPWKYRDWRDYREKTGRDFVRENLGLWLLESADNGRSWTREARIETASGKTEIFPYGKIVELGGGRLLMPTQSYFGGSRSGVLKSDDSGKTWGTVSTIGQPGDETSVIELSRGNLLAVDRAGVPGRASGRLARYVSTDGGDTWATPEETVMADWPDDVSTLGYPLLHRAASGTLMLFYRFYHRGGPEKGGFGLGVSWSADEGLTWKGKLELSDPKSNPGPFKVNIGGMDALNLPDGRILAVMSLLYKAKYLVANILEENVE